MSCPVRSSPSTIVINLTSSASQILNSVARVYETSRADAELIPVRPLALSSAEKPDTERALGF